jgi:hypothetical protein
MTTKTVQYRWPVSLPHTTWNQSFSSSDTIHPFSWAQTCVPEENFHFGIVAISNSGGKAFPLASEGSDVGPSAAEKQLSSFRGSYEGPMRVRLKEVP